LTAAWLRAFIQADAYSMVSKQGSGIGRKTKCAEEIIKAIIRRGLA